MLISLSAVFAVSGLGPLMIGDEITTAGMAVKLGAAAQAAVKGLAAGGREATSGKPAREDRTGAA